MRDTIIFAGGYGLPDRTASGIRVLGMATLFRRLGYQVLVLGKFEQAPTMDAAEHEKIIDDIPCRDIRQPLPGQVFRSYVVSAHPVIAAVDEIGALRVRAVLAYNYPARGAFALIRACQSRGIAPVLECADWYGWEGRKILRNLWRLTGVAVRMHILTRLAGNIICASSWLQNKLPGQHTLLLPWVIDITHPRWARAELEVPSIDRPVRFVYSGSPGVGLYKDRLPLMIEALTVLAREGHLFDCTIAGLTEAQYLAVVPQHRDCLREIGDQVRFLGRISHTESITLVRNADFSVFFRETNRMSSTGFPTKFVEATTLGVPVISNATSDIPRYLRDGVNGIMATGVSKRAVSEALRRAVNMSAAERGAMQVACRTDNPFGICHWAEPTKCFLDDLRGMHD
ncbi:MAG: glycosyltransferase [Pseudomonadales bacterium]|nr:glycosyltransferase [Pseudomonadales bacterium]